MGGKLGLAGPARARGPGLALDADGEAILDGRAGDQLQAWLTAADQLQIDFGQELGVEQRAVLAARRIIDGKAAQSASRLA